MNILLFDMDGVLLESRGYHLALQETVRYIAKALGFGDLTLSADDIATFEAAGVNKEWDEAAIATALLLESAWKIDPLRDLPSNPLTSNAPLPNLKSIPDFNALARRFSAPDMLRLHPLDRAVKRFTESDHFSKVQYDILHALINGARDPEHSLTHRLFQELVLGSAEYTHTYNLPALLKCESYLLKYDISNLSQAESAHLRDWMSAPDHAAAVITSRPSLPPAGIFSTPEAELGAELVGLKDIPIVGWGGISWLAQQRQTDQQKYVKPSPVHALTAMLVALGDEQKTALIQAADLVEIGQAAPAWQKLAGAHVSMFEDTPTGIKSLQDARLILGNLGINIIPNYFGIASKAVKIDALLANEAQVFPTFVQALDQSM